jgi:hypothetical protein
VMGDLADDDRSRGMGIVIEYAGKSGKPSWTKPAPFKWGLHPVRRVGLECSEPG